MYKEVESNQRKTAFLMAFFVILIIALGWAFSYIFDSYLILAVAVVIAIVQSWVSYFYSDKIVLTMVGAKGPIEKKDDPRLYRLVENLSITAGLPMPKVYIVEDQSLNAFATGRDPDHAAVAVTRGLLNRLKKVELEGVLAHEMSHIGNRDILLQTVVVTLVGVIVLMSDFFLRWSFLGIGGRRRRSGGGQLGAILVLVGIILAILSPLFAKLIQLSISRKREYLADSSGALLTRFPEGLARALKKISLDATPMLRTSKATAHLFICDPIENLGKSKKSFSTLFSTHPPVDERIEKLNKMIVK